jgi:hypothetical protein
MSQNVEIVNYSHPPQIKKIFAQRQVSCSFALPVSNMSQGMFDCNPFSEFRPSLRG